MSTLGKRVTYKRKRPNPLFQEWLEELHVEAQEKGSKLEPMLREALDSLSKYPLPLNSGAECAILRGFHKKLCVFLDRRLDVYRNNLNECKDDECVKRHEVTSSDDSSQEEFNLKSSNFKDTEYKPLKLNMDTVDTNVKNSSALSPSSFAFDSLINDYKLECSITKRKSDEFESPKRITIKEISSHDSNEIINLNLEYNNGEPKNYSKYKPQYRSGGYAILIALLEHYNQNNANSSLTKEKLIEKAQQHCEESFTRPKPNTYYTAWSNMGRLISKGLINKLNKKKTYYSLTKEGMTLANELLKESATIPTTNDIIFNNASLNKEGLPKHTIVTSPIKVSDRLNTKTTLPDVTKTISSITSSNPDSLMTKRIIDRLNFETKNKNKPITTSHSFPSSTITSSNIDSTKKGVTPVITPMNTKTIDSLESVSIVSSTTGNSDSLVNKKYPASSNNSFGNGFKLSPIMTSNTDNHTWKIKLSKPVPPANSVVRSLADSSEETDTVKVIEFPKASFDIVLLIDKNETSGVSKRNDPTVAQFQKFPDLKHEYRSLKVGDFVWIARHRINKEELVLPYIVERKRMDDLGASIKDGRFHEQKFRLKKCGLAHVTYLIESYGKNKHVGLPLQSLKQAITNTKVQDGFKIYMTASLTHSTRFLAMMTKRLTLEFEDQVLKGCNGEPLNGLLTTFQYFSKASVKTKKLTVTETFIKMLLQLKGMSLEKALSVTNKYNTPRSLMEAFKCCKVDGHNLLANLKYGDTNRNIGPAISKSIYDLFSELPSE